MTKKHKEAVDMLNELENLKIRVEVDNQFGKKEWIALSRVVYFLLKEYVLSTDKEK